MGINEGPWMIESEGVYYLMYSGAGADTKYYNLGYATSESPVGPFVKADAKAEGNPIIQDPIEKGVFGPGHHGVWMDRVTGKNWVVYHRKRTTENGWDRVLCVDEV